MAEEKERIGFELGMGWLPDYPDFRDYTIEKKGVTSKRAIIAGQKDSVKDMLKKVGAVKTSKTEIPTSIDLRRWCPPIENQGSIGSCTANAGVGLVEYYERRAFDRHIDASRLFLYKTTRNLLGWTGDRGAFIRTTMAAMVLFGIPPERYWPYVKEDFDKEPSSFCYSFAQNYQAIQYFRLDSSFTSKKSLLKLIKTLLAFGLPSMFGFTVFNSIRQARKDGKITFPCLGEKILGGHAVMAVGYDDDIKIKNTTCGVEKKGALLIRNSWGTSWGERGYGWLPYEYVLTGLARDWWTLLKNEWVNTKKFGL
ncbi:MAG: C1 family peptidase [Candidatus Humimicrobiia bacterium]